MRLLRAWQAKLNREQGKTYQANDKRLQNLKAGQHKTAAVIHLYYTDSWPLISQKLKNLSVRSFDLFVSLPLAGLDFAEHIHADFPEAYTYPVPNRGRDVLPFLYIAGHLRQAGYEYVLKIHSKKSIHRSDGREWLDDMLNSLLPAEKTVQARLRQVLSDSSTGIVGPSGQYLHLGVNFEANGRHMTAVLNALYDKAVSYDVLQKNRDDYGFFAGTMFWARLDALDPILKEQFKLSRFESENGQIDATFAHALERILCLVPEIDRKKLYEISATGVREIAYKTDNIPDWSDIYIGPKES